MKRNLIFIIAIFAQMISFAQKYGYYNIEPTNRREVCPEEYYVYSRYVSYGNNYNTSWDVQNGIFDNGKTYMKDVVAVRVKWNDNTSIGKLTLTISSNEGITYNNGRSSILEQRILSVVGTTPTESSINDTNIPFGDRNFKVTLVKMNYPYSNTEITRFEWTLPKGWHSGSQSGTFIAGNAINITTDNLSEGNITVRAVGNCGSAKGGGAKNTTYRRQFNFEKYPSYIPYGSLDQYTFKVNDINLSGIQYEWKVPSGWKINGGNNTLVSNVSSVQIQAANPNNSGPIQVRLKLGNELSKWYSCPYDGIQSFDGNLVNMELYNERLYASSNIYVENVSIKSGANVILNGYNSVRIVPGFVAEAGSTVRIYNGVASKSMSKQYIDSKPSAADNTNILQDQISSLGQNIPNPFTDETQLNCYISENAVSCYIQIGGILGNVVKKIPVTQSGENQILVKGSELGAGIYTYSLIVDGKLIDTKRMIVK